MPEKLRRVGYLSEIDRFLREFDKNRKSYPESRIRECEKFKKIYAKRDNIIEEETSPIWKEF